MTTDLTMLVWSAVLCVLLAMPYTLGLTRELGLPRLAGNRENFPQVEGWIGRSIRAHRNLVENLAPFAALVLVAHVAGKAGSDTALGAQLFFWARLVHAGLYIAGVAWLRTAAFAVSLIGMVFIVLAIFR
jgi:uncharacterized MAPEG superfamily protein